MKLATFTSCVGLIALLSAAQAVADPCQNPKRLVNGYTIDLKPLFAWWPAPKGARPLSAWKHVQGSITQDTPAGWVLSGKAEGFSGSSFIVRNPPREKLLRWEKLRENLSQLEIESEATTRFASRPVCTDWYSYWVTPWPSPPITLIEHRQATTRLAELRKQIHMVEDELGAMTDNNGRFRLDAFALRLKENVDGLPVFDHGATATFSQPLVAY